MQNASTSVMYALEPSNEANIACDTREDVRPPPTFALVPSMALPLVSVH